jgi:hypothetical protein
MENAAVYQLKIVLRGIKPPVWRRVLVRTDCSIAVLHEIVQIAMGWWNCHLHRFLIRGKEYGVAYEGGVSFADDPDQTRLGDFRFRTSERFGYLYDFGDNWDHDIVVEKILPLDPAKAYPLCVTGRGECPEEDSGGPYLYKARRAKRMPKPSGAKDRFDPDSVNVVLRDIQSRWFKRATNVP